MEPKATETVLPKSNGHINKGITAVYLHVTGAQVFRQRNTFFLVDAAQGAF